MNELQQVLLIFAVVVIAGLYFLSRSRQADSNKHNSEEKAVDSAKEPTTQKADHEISEKVYAAPAHEKAGQALNELGEAHIPVSESTEKRLIPEEASDTDGLTDIPKHSEDSATPKDDSSVESSSNNENVNPNQGTLFFGDDFDLPEQKQSDASAQQTEESHEKPQAAEEPAAKIDVGEDQPSPEENKGKHHVLIVDDPGMTGELDSSNYPKEEIKPSFGIPAEEIKPEAILTSTNKEPEVFVLLVMSTANEFPMAQVNQALFGVGLSLSEQAIFVKNDNMGNPFIKVANMLEPGSFPSENLDDYATPGVAMILELPTTVRAPAAMHELIMMARKVSQRLNGRLYNMERQLIKESDLQSMRDAALDYESEPLT